MWLHDSMSVVINERQCTKAMGSCNAWGSNGWLQPQSHQQQQLSASLKLVAAVCTQYMAHA
jgi:hypothetical protein